ncbi:hypothetical protein B0H10DRAFT_2211188 [Mycena sp. CBHHK59/15]|nr:hypothetical protein B0H10DRAFT_2211188 [Mycena sp. CBHHK59/15]
MAGTPARACTSASGRRWERPNVTHKMRELRAFVDSPPPAYTHRGRNSPRAR